MPRQAATIGSLPQAFEGVKEMQAGGPDRGEGYRPLGRQGRPGSSRAGIIEDRMAEAVDVWRYTLDAGAARLLPLQDPCRAKAGQDHQCHRTTVPRGPQTNTAHGNIPGPDIDGPHPPRGLYARKQLSGNRHPRLPDT